MKIIALKTDLTGICFLLDIPEPKKDIRKKSEHGTLINLEAQENSLTVCKSNWQQLNPGSRGKVHWGLK